jgi:hypothetical protein
MDSVACRPGTTKFEFLPFGTGELNDPASFGRALERLTENYDLIVLDMAPTVARDGDFWCGAVDGLVTVVEWGRVPASLVQGGVEALRESGVSQKALVGFVFNKVKRSKIDRSEFPLEHYRWSRRARRR